MSTTKLLFAEIAHRRGSFLLSLVAIVAAATLVVAGPAILRGYSRETETLVEEKEKNAARELTKMRERTDAGLAAMQRKNDEELAKLDDETRKTMLKLGLNLRIVHRDTDMTNFYVNFVAKEMPEAYVEKLAKSPLLTKITHIVATLNARIEWEGRQRLIVGFSPEATQPHVGVKKPISYVIPRGEVFLAHEAGIGHTVGEEVEVLGHTFRVGRILPAQGDMNDLMIAMHLKDAQKVLKKEGIVTEILALGCKCETLDRVAEIREQLEQVLPEAKVTEWSKKAQARFEQRDQVAKRHKEMVESNRIRSEKIQKDEEEHQQALLADWKEKRESGQRTLSVLVGVITPLVVVICAVWVGLLAWTNVRQRRAEIGLLRALGRETSNIAALLVGKAVLLGVVGGVVGCLVGWAAARWIALGPMEIDAANLPVSTVALAMTILGAPILSALASYPPAMFAIGQDPAVVLREE